MQRINSVGLAASASGFDPLQIARGAQMGAQIIAPIVEGIAAKADAVQRIEERGASLFATVERARIERETAADLENVRNTMPESGAGYATAAQNAAEARYLDARARAGGDPLKLQKLEDQHKIDKESRRASFEEGERNYGRAYALNQHALSVDNAKQEIGRSPSGASAYDHSGVSASAASALAALEAATGETFKINSAYRDPSRNKAAGGAKKSQHMHGNAFDIDVSGKSESERVALIKQARAAGFGGVGVYDNSLHFDVGATRHWGPDYHAGSLPSWAAEAVGAERGAVPDATDQNGLPLYVGDPPSVFDNPVMSSHRSELYEQIDAMPITAADKADLKRKADGELVMVGLQRMGEENPSAALAALRSGAYDDAISYADDQRMQGGFSSILEKQVTERAKEQLAIARDEAGALLGDNLAWQAGGRQGDAPPALAPSQFDLLTNDQQARYDDAVVLGGAVAQAQTVDLAKAPAWLESLKPSGAGFEQEAAAYEAASKAVAVRQEAAAVDGSITAALAAGVAPDMSSDGVKKRVGVLFDDALGTSADPFGAAAQFIADRRVAPERFGGMVAQAMSSDDPAVTLQAVEAVARINAADPRLLANAPNGVAIDRAIAVSEFMNLGMSGKDALEFTRAMTDPNKKGEIAARGDLWTANKSALENQAHDAFIARLEKRGQDKGLGSGDASAAIPASVWGEYADLVKDKYAVTGNVEVAVATAERAFFASHAVTRVGGVAQWQAGAPEAHYGIYGDDRDSAWLEAQGMAFAGKALGKPVDTITLQPIGDARRMEKPGYAATAVMADGSTVAVPGVFKPDPKQEAPAVAAASKRDLAATDARRAVQRLIVDRETVVRQLMAGTAARDDPAKLEVLRKRWFDLKPMIRAAQEKSASMQANVSNANEPDGGADLFGALPVIAP